MIRILSDSLGRAIAAVIVLFVLAACLACRQPDDTLPVDTNLILVVVDTLRQDRLGEVGEDNGITPFLDRVGDESVRFHRAIAPSSWTKPSVASLMTGLYPGRHGAVGITRRLQRHGGSPVLDQGQVTLAETLRDAGFSTATFATNVNISVKHHFDQGFDHFVQPAGDVGELCSKALKWVGEREAGERFFLYLHILDPHAPYEPPEPFKEQFADPDPPEGGPFSRRGLTNEMEWWSEQYGRWLKEPGRGPFQFHYGDFNLAWARDHFPQADEPEFSYIFASMDHFQEKVGLAFTGPEDPALHRRIGVLTSLYDGVVASVDHALADFFDGLERQRLLSRSVVVITSDHGEAFLEHHVWGHRWTVHGEEINIPLIWRVPDGQGGLLQREVDSIVSLVDLYPTVMEMFGLPCSGEVDGVSLWPAIRGVGDVAREGPVFSELLLDNRSSVTALQGNRKLIRTIDETGKIGWELYNVSRDPGEREPASYRGKLPPAGLLRAGIDSRAASWNLLRSGPGESAGLSPEERERLDALGYLAREDHE